MFILFEIIYPNFTQEINGKRQYQCMKEASAVLFGIDEYTKS